MFKISHFRFWMWKQIGCTISRSWLYHQSWPIDCKIYHSFLSYNWSYPLMIGRAICRRTLQLNMRLRTTWAEWLQDLRQLVHYPTSIRVVATGYDRSYVQSCHESSVIRSIARPVVRLTAPIHKTNLCMRSKFCISSNIHDQLYVLHIYRNRTTKNIVLSSLTIA